MDQSTDCVNASLALDAPVHACDDTTSSIAQRLSRPDPSAIDAAAADPSVIANGESAAVDLELVRLAQAGDEEAFGRLVERNRRAVYRAAYAALGSADDADDVAQETFVTVFRKLGGFRGEASFKTWLLAIAWRKALDRRRSVSRWIRLTVAPGQHSAEAGELLDRLPSTAQSQEEGLASDELQQQVKQLIRTLPRKLRDALLLAGSGDYSYDQIARMLGVPVGTVKWRVAEARRILKRKLAATGYANE